MTVYVERDQGSELADFLIEHAQLLSIAAFFAVCLVFFSVFTDVFLSVGNILNVLRQAAPLLVVSVAMTFVIVTAGIDLSVGSQMALVNALVAMALAAGLPWPIAVIAMLVLGGFVGVIHGWFVSYQGVPSFIVTLATLSILRGVALYLTKGYSIPITGVPDFLAIGRGTIGGIPAPVIIAAVVSIIGYIVIRMTKYGRQVVAVGSNPEAARRVGMPARRVIASVYVVSGVASAIAGILLAARLGSGSSNAAVGFELQAIAAVVLGGTSLMGGRGTILGTVLGALTIAVIGNGLILMHISPFFTQIVTGTIILAAIWINTRIFSTQFRLKRRKED